MSCGNLNTRSAWWWRAGLVMLSVACWAGTLTAVNAADVVRVEEDWELVVKTPEWQITAPQVSCAMSPTGDMDGLHAIFEINHQTYPYFGPGGLKLQVWNGDDSAGEVRVREGDLMTEPNETVRWTSVMAIEEGQLRFAITQGSSQTWGEFGRDESPISSRREGGPDNLNAYSPDVSVENSGVSFAANRVQSLVLKEVRYIRADGTTTVDATQRTVE